MICKRCKKVDTCNPDHICGFCHLGVLTYWQKEDFDIKNMEQRSFLNSL